MEPLGFPGIATPASVEGAWLLHQIVKIPDTAKTRLTILLLVQRKAADDADSAHCNLRRTLEEIGLTVVTGDQCDLVSESAAGDFAIPLFNRTDGAHDEMLALFELARLGIPFVGAPPSLHGIVQDRNTTKLIARARGIPTPEWKLYRKDGWPITPPAFTGEGLTVRPNAASFNGHGIRLGTWHNVSRQIRRLHDRGRDAIVETWVPGIDIEVPVIGGDMGRPWILPGIAYVADAPSGPYSPNGSRMTCMRAVADERTVNCLDKHLRLLLDEFWPFDHGTFRFRYDPASASLWFTDVDLSSGLWSSQTSPRSADSLGLTRRDLVETIVARSMGRQRLIPAVRACPIY